MLDPQELKATHRQRAAVVSGHLFRRRRRVRAGPYRASVGRAAERGAAALFAAGGTGEFFSIGARRISEHHPRAVEGAGGRVPIVAGCGYGTRIAVQLARAAEAAGAAGILLLPHYLVHAEQAGLFAHVKAVCDAVKHRRHRLQPRQFGLDGRDARPPGGGLPQPHRLQGRLRRRRARDEDHDAARRPAGLCRRHADARGLCRALLCGGRHDLFLRRLQFHAAGGACLLFGAGRGRHGRSPRTCCGGSSIPISPSATAAAATRSPSSRPGCA